MKLVFIISSFLVFLLMASCAENENLTISQDDRGFYPLSVGNFWEYEVQQTLFDARGPAVSNFFLREVVEDTLVFSDGSLRYLIQRYRKDSLQGDWFKNEVISLEQSPQLAVLTEGGIPVVKQVYPVENGLEWNANVRNNLETDFFSYIYPRSDTTIGDSTYSNIMKLELDEPTINLTQELSRFEIYSRGVGLLVKDYTSLNFNTIQGDENEGEIESGFILKQSIIAYGRE